jgi:hypothetical protein
MLPSSGGSKTVDPSFAGNSNALYGLGALGATAAVAGGALAVSQQQQQQGQGQQPQTPAHSDISSTIGFSRQMATPDYPVKDGLMADYSHPSLSRLQSMGIASSPNLTAGTPMDLNGNQGLVGMNPPTSESGTESGIPLSRMYSSGGSSPIAPQYAQPIMGHHHALGGASALALPVATGAFYATHSSTHSQSQPQSQDDPSLALVQATSTYSAVRPDELSLQPGDMIQVEQQFEDGWAFGHNLNSQSRGMFPFNFVVPLSSGQGEQQQPMMIQIQNNQEEAQ